MSVAINNSPFHDTAMITNPYGAINPRYSCGWHTGVDIVGLNNLDVYSVSTGIVIDINTNPNDSLGIYVLIMADNGNYFRYCHLVDGSVVVSVSQYVTINTKIGIMGATGDVTGPHLHLEYSSTRTWDCSTFLNPCNYLGIPNEDDLLIYYTPIGPTPSYTKKSKFPWVLYAKKLRKKRG